MSEKPMLFSGDMVRAILSGAKVQTRRIIKPQPPRGSTWGADSRLFLIPDSPFGVIRHNPYPVGTILWVRETYGQTECREYAPGGASMATGELRMVYRASQPNAEPEGGWKPSIHCPRWAARLFLRVVEVRAERLQEISEEDAIAEGVFFSCLRDPIKEFAELWDSIYGEKPGSSWADSPFVWAITFERTEEPTP